LDWVGDWITLGFSISGDREFEEWPFIEWLKSKLLSDKRRFEDLWWLLLFREPLRFFSIPFWDEHVGSLLDLIGEELRFSLLEVPRSDDVDKSRFLDVRLLVFEVTPFVSDTPSNWDGILILFKLNMINKRF